MTESNPQAGWYKDPAGHADERRWDGEKWTAEVRRSGEHVVAQGAAESAGPEAEQGQQTDSVAEEADATTLGWHPDPREGLRVRFHDGTRWTAIGRIRRVRPQKGGAVLVIFAAFAAAIATVITAVYLGELASASRYSSPNPDALPVAALLYGASGVLTLWAIYRGLEQINDIYENVGWASDERLATRGISTCTLKTYG